MLYGKTATGVTAATESGGDITLGTGEVTIYQFTNNTDGIITATGGTRAVYNFSTYWSVAGGAYLMCDYVCGRLAVISVGSCDDLVEA